MLLMGFHLKTLEKRTSSLLNDKQKNNVIKKQKEIFQMVLREYGADALEIQFLCNGLDRKGYNFDLNRIEGYRNFCNKIWNASRYILMSCEHYQYQENLNSDDSTIFDKWILYKLDSVVNDLKNIQQLIDLI